MDQEKNKLGLWTSTSLVAGNMIGSGIFLMPVALASFGAISILGWLIAATGSIILAKVFANLSKLVPQADGGPYAYTSLGLGSFAAFLVAWGYWISVWCSNAAITVSLVSALSTFFPVLALNPVIAVITGLSFIWFLSWINTLGIVTSGLMQLITTLLKIIPLVMVGICGLFYIHSSYFFPFNNSGLNNFEAIISSASLTFFAFVGFECATIPACSVSCPEKTISRATMIGTLLVTIIYILSSTVILGMIPADLLLKSVTPFADAARIIWGESSQYWVAAGVAIAAFGALNGWILIQGQMPLAVAKDQLFPIFFARKNKYAVPANGIIFSSVLVSILMCMNFTKGLVDQYKFLILLSTATVIVAYLFSTVSYIIINYRRGLGKNMSVLLLVIPAFCFSLFALAGSGRDSVYWGFLLLMAGIPIYVSMIKNQHNRF
jgi:APA family basic amino acid/polyamine antiporter